MFSDSPSRRRVLLLVGALAVVLSLLAGVVGAGAVVALGSLSAPPAAVAEALFPWLVAAALLTLTALALAGALGWLAVTRLAAAVGDRLYLAALGTESRHEWAARLGLADRLAPLTPRDTDAVSRLQQRYVDGDLDERTFERELDALLDEGGDGATGDGSSGSGGGSARSRAGVGRAADRARHATGPRTGTGERRRTAETESADRSGE
jgi:hypothetical protein